MKIVINRCFGGFGLSRSAVKRIAELSGRPCYFFTHARDKDRMLLDSYAPLAEGEEPFMWMAFDIPNPNEVLGKQDAETWHAG